MFYGVGVRPVSPAPDALRRLGERGASTSHRVTAPLALRRGKSRRRSPARRPHGYPTSLLLAVRPPPAVTPQAQLDRRAHHAPAVVGGAQPRALVLVPGRLQGGTRACQRFGLHGPLLLQHAKRGRTAVPPGADGERQVLAVA